MSKKALILTSKLVQDHEFIYPFYRLKEENFDIHTCNGENKQVLGYFGTKIPPKEEDKIVKLNEVDCKNYSLLVLPGGVKSMEIMRLNQALLDLIKNFHDNKTIIAATCSAAMLLISAKITKGKSIAGYYAWKDDIVNSGGKFVDMPCVIDGNLVTSPHYKYVADWMKGTIDLYKKNT
jgi:protease I